MRIVCLSAFIGMLAAVVALSACHAPKNAPGNAIDDIDNALVEGAASNLADGDLGKAIRVDPKRTGRNAAVTATATPARADGSTCLGRNREKLEFARDWAAKLPADLPLPPNAKLSEVAGRSGDCELRAASFTVPTAPEATIAWYEQAAKRHGWDAGRTTRDGQVWVAGTKGDAAFTVMTTAAAHGTAVDYIWSKGA